MLKVRGKKHHDSSGESQASTTHIELKATFVGIDEIMVPDWDGVWNLSYMFVFLPVWPEDSSTATLSIFAEMQV